MDGRPGYLGNSSGSQCTGVLGRGVAFVKRPRSDPLYLAVIRREKAESGPIGACHKLDNLVEGYVPFSLELAVYPIF